MREKILNMGVKDGGRRLVEGDVFVGSYGIQKFCHILRSDEKGKNFFHGPPLWTSTRCTVQCVVC